MLEIASILAGDSKSWSFYNPLSHSKMFSASTLSLLFFKFLTFKYLETRELYLFLTVCYERLFYNRLAILDHFLPKSITAFINKIS